MLVTSCSVSTWLLGTWQKLACNRNQGGSAVCSKFCVTSAAAPAMVGTSVGTPSWVEVGRGDASINLA